MHPSLRHRSDGRSPASLLLALAIVACAFVGSVSVPVASAASPAPAGPAAPGGPAPSIPLAPANRAPLTLDSDLRLPSDISAWAIDEFLAANTPLPPLGAAFKAAERNFHVNALYLVAHAMHESDFGRSYLAQSYHNLFGWNAFDRDPIAFATRFASFEDSISFVAAKVAAYYLDPAGIYYGGAPTLNGMYRYATDPAWGERIVSIANSMSLPTLSERGITLVASFAKGSIRTGDATSVAVIASPADGLPNGLQLAGRVRRAGAVAPTIGSGSDGEYVLTAARSSGGRFVVPIQVGPNPGRYVMELVLVDADGFALPAADAVRIPDLVMDVVPLFDVAIEPEPSDDVIFRVSNVGASAVPALGPQIGTVVAGRAPSVLVTWLVRPGTDLAELQRLALPSDLKAKGSWDAVLDLGDVTLQPGDVLVARLEVPDPTGVPQATTPEAFRVSTVVEPSLPGSDSHAVSGGDIIGLTALKADDPLALAAIALIAPPPAVAAGIAAGAGVTP